MPIIRIAPICNGKIYVVPHLITKLLDFPLTDSIRHKPYFSSTKPARHLIKKYTKEIQTHERPRLSVKYMSPIRPDEEVYLYILPLKTESEINFKDGSYVSPDDIEMNAGRYSEYIQKESGLLSMASELWKNYL